MESSDKPYILEQTDDFAVVFKPAKMHSVPLKQKDGCPSNDSKDDGISLHEWYADKCPSVYDIMHRLDFETHGLVLFAKNQKSFYFFRSLQDRGDFVKEYSAVCSNSLSAPQSAVSPAFGFPPPPHFPNSEPSPQKPLVIMSYFRPYGPGRKLVRPVTDAAKKHKEIAKDNGGFYRTEITGVVGNVFTARIKRGFRHQIRCHLAWVGCPILNDELYNYQLSINNEQLQIKNEKLKMKNEQGAGSGERGLLALRAHGLFFRDPSSGERREYCIGALGVWN